MKPRAREGRDFDLTPKILWCVVASLREWAEQVGPWVQARLQAADRNGPAKKRPMYLALPANPVRLLRSFEQDQADNVV